MRSQITVGPLIAFLRECWVVADNLRLSTEDPTWTDRLLLHAIIVESVTVDESQRRQGHLKRFLESLCADPRFEIVIVEGVQNPHLASALWRWGWECDVGIGDYYHWN